ncbi:MAG: helix-turn-helix domain-containing protein [Chloroflexota bacterium]
MPEDIRKAIHKLLCDTGKPMTAQQIADAIKRKKSSWLMTHIKALVAVGLVNETVPERSGNGRPAHLYAASKRSEQGDLRRQWQAWCAANFALDYLIWLELVARGEIDRTGG